MRRYRTSGYTAVELCIALSLIGTVLVVSVPTFVKQLRRGRVSEATVQLANLYKLTSAYYSTAHGTKTRCLPPSAGPAPANPSADPQAVNFSSPTTPGAPTWKALGFQPDHGVRYAYTYSTEAAGCNANVANAPPSLFFRAYGDLDADGEFSTFERQATASPTGLVPAPALQIQARVE